MVMRAMDRGARTDLNCQGLCFGALKNVGIGWNRTAGDRMMLTERQGSSLQMTVYGAAMYGTNSAPYIWHSSV